jgi:hypothetical protein
MVVSLFDRGTPVTSYFFFNIYIKGAHMFLKIDPYRD